MHPVYPTETSPKISFGIPEDFSLIILGASCLAMVFTGKIPVLIVTFVVSYFLGLYWTSRDPDFFHIFWVKYFKLPRTHTAFPVKGRRYSA